MIRAEVLEGTWDEIQPQAEAIARRHKGKSFKLIFLTEASEKPQPAARDLSPEERIRLLDELAEKNRHLPVLPSEAFERDSIYEDRF